MQAPVPDSERSAAEARLAAAWLFLRGQPRDFGAHLPLPAPRPQPSNARHLLMAASLPQRGGDAGVGLVLDRSEAIGIAAAMFDMHPSDLTEADIDDACGEACNVMSACVTGALALGHPTTFERPCGLSAEGYRAITETSVALASFVGDTHADNAGHVSLTVFDPLHRAAHQEHKP